MWVNKKAQQGGQGMGRLAPLGHLAPARGHYLPPKEALAGYQVSWAAPETKLCLGIGWMGIRLLLRKLLSKFLFFGFVEVVSSECKGC